MVRWNWYGLFYAVGDGILYCVLAIFAGVGVAEELILQYFVTYAVGNAFVGLAFLMVRFAGYKRITGRWYFTA